MSNSFQFLNVVCHCFVGYTEGSTEVQGFQSVGLSNFAYNYNVTLSHTSIIHITVAATNAAGLRREAHGEDLLVDLTPPNILFINDGKGTVNFANKVIRV